MDGLYTSNSLYFYDIVTSLDRGSVVPKKQNLHMLNKPLTLIGPPSRLLLLPVLALLRTVSVGLVLASLQLDEDPRARRSVFSMSSAAMASRSSSGLQGP